MIRITISGDDLRGYVVTATRGQREESAFAGTVQQLTAAIERIVASLRTREAVEN